MKNLCFLLLIFGLFGFSNPPQGAKGTLVVSVENVNKQSGDLRLGLYISKSSYDAEDNPDYWIVHKVESTGTVRVVIEDLPFGKYAIAMIHDVNGNTELDYNFVGVPKEPYGFSKKSARFKKPAFNEVNFDFSSDQQQVKVQLVEW